MAGKKKKSGEFESVRVESGELPVGWVMTTLGNHSDIQSGVGFPLHLQGSKQGAFPVYKVGDLSRAVLGSKGNLSTSENFVSEAVAKELKGHIFPAGATLFAKIGEAVKLNRRAFVHRAGLADNNVMGVIAHSSLNAKYAYLLLRTIDLSDISRSTTVPSIRKGDIENLKLPLAPLPEQKIIADRLDALLAQVDSLKARLDAIPAILKRFRQAVLSAAVSGKLTEDWRGENALLGWSEKNLKELTTKISDGEHITPKRTDSGHYLLSARNVQNGRLSFESVDYVGDDEYQRIRKRCDPSIGDVLLSCSGSVGRVALVDKNDEYVLVRSVAFLRPNTRYLESHYLTYGLQSPYLQRQIQEKSSSTAQSNIFLGSIKELLLPLPPLPEQTEIVRRVEQLFVFADQVEARVQAAQGRTQHLTQAILAKAFRGELTADWREAHASAQ